MGKNSRKNKIDLFRVFIIYLLIVGVFSMESLKEKLDSGNGKFILEIITASSV
jgi:hypothetical protein